MFITFAVLNLKKSIYSDLIIYVGLIVLSVLKCKIQNWRKNQKNLRRKMTKKFNVSNIRKMIELSKGDVSSSRKQSTKVNWKVIVLLVLVYYSNDIILNKMLFDVRTNASKINSTNGKDEKWRPVQQWQKLIRWQSFVLILFYNFSQH